MTLARDVGLRIAVAAMFSLIAGTVVLTAMY